MIKQNKEQKKSKKYCDWKYILMFLLWTVVVFYDECCPNQVETTTGGAVILFLVWLGVSLWIIEQGKEAVK